MTTSMESLRDVVEAQVDQHPDRPAVGSEGSGWLSFRELNHAADRLAVQLQERGAAQGTRVGVLLPRSGAAVVAILATWKAGAAYVPIDPAAPAAFRRFALRDSDASVVIVDDTWTDKLPEGIRRCPVSPAMSSREPATDPVRVPLRGEDEAWILYTSGSTGRPKGVIGPHRASLNRCAWMWDTSPFAEGEVSVQNTGLTVVDSVWEIWGSLARGIPVVLPQLSPAPDPDSLIEVLAANRVSRICLVPSLLRSLLDVGRPLGARVPHLHRWVSSGETLDRALTERFYREVPGGVLLNQYGLTESCADVTTFDTRELGHRGGAGGAQVPIGRPIAGVRIRVAGPDLCPVPAGEVGELYLKGAALALGYANNPDLTAERFLPDPFDADGGAMFRTGDLVRERSDGVLEHLGRIDRQVKIRGFRVEPEGVEAELGAHPQVGTAAVTGLPDPHGGVRLAAYVVPADAARPPTPAHLRAHLTETLPLYMVPASFTVMDRLPLTTTGKTDYGSLPTPTARTVDQRYVAPRTSLQRSLVELWGELLAVDEVGIDDDFFELGGHSLAALRMINEVNVRERTRIVVPEFVRRPTVDQLAQLAIRGREQAGVEAEGVDRSPRATLAMDLPSPLSSTQEAMWLHEQWSEAPGLYNISLTFRINGWLDLAALRRALDAVVDAHASLRTTVVAEAGFPKQVRVARAACPVVEHDLPEAAELAGLLEAESSRPFDLTRAPLLRACVVRINETDQVLALTVHHIACDGRSIPVLLHSVSSAYETAVAGREIDLERSAPPDSIAVDASVPSGPGADEELTVTLLPTDRPRPATPTGYGATLDFVVEPVLTSRVITRSREVGVTPFVVTCSALAVVLGTYTDREQLALAVPVANRLTPAAEQAVGCLMRTVAVRIDLSGDPTVGEVLRRVRTEVWRSSFATGTVELRERSTRPPPVMLAYDDAHALSFTLAGLRTAPMTVAGRSSKVDLTLFLDHGNDRYYGRVEYATALFDAETVEAFTQHFRTALEQLCDERTRRLSEISVLGIRERALVVEEWNATERADYPLTTCLHELMAGQIRRHPDAPAVCGKDRRTHADLDDDANRVARALRMRGLDDGAVVGVHMDRSLDLLVVLMAILKAGCAYLPLEPDQPRARLQGFVQDASARLVITDAPTGAWTERDWGQVALVHLDTLVAAARPLAAEPLGTTTGSGSPAYVIFTSGSTGRPKGVVISHSSVVNRLIWMQETFPLSPSDCVLQKTPFGFDVSVWELFWPFLAGARIEVAAPGGHRDPGYLAQTIRSAGVTTLHFVPSVLRLFLEHPAASRCTNLARVFVSGEALPPDLITQALRTFPAELHNLYGPTEATVDVTWWPCRSEQTSSGTVPIGRPIANTEAYILDRRRRPVPIGVPGELYLGGVQIALGYIGRPDLTSERFVPDPFRPGGRLYRTGDLGRWHRDGHLEFLGRLDRQMKIAGVRVEPAEIEVLLRGHSDVQDAVVVPNVEGQATALVAYIVPRSGTGPPAGVLRGYLGGRLPLAVIPADFFAIPVIPRLSNGKINRRALQPPDSMGEDVSSMQSSPGKFNGSTRDTARAVWKRALKCAIDDRLNFVEAGGDSITAIRVILEVNRRVGSSLSPYSLLQAMSFDDFAARLAANLLAADPEETPLRLDVPPQRTIAGMGVTSVLQERLFTLDSAGYGHFDMLVEVHGPLRPELFPETVVWLCRRHAILRSIYEPGSPPSRRIDADWRPATRATNLLGRDQREVKDTVAAAIDRSMKRFDITQEVPFELELLTLASDRSLLIGRMHHIATDGWSTTLLFEEFERIYAELEAGRDPSQLPAAPQYESFAQAQRAYLESRKILRARTHWQRVFDGCTGPTTIPRTVDEATSAVNDPDLATFVHVLHPPDRVAALKTYARERRSTLFTVLVTAFTFTLREAAGVSDLVFGTSSARRHLPGTDRTIGDFVNPLPIRIDIGAADDLDDVHGIVRERLLSLSRFQDYLLADMVQHVAPFVGSNLNNTFDVYVVFQNYPSPSFEGLRRYDVIDFQDHGRERPLGLPTFSGKIMREFELIIFGRPDGALSLNFGYKHARFTDAQVRSWVNVYTEVLDRVAGAALGTK